MTKDQRKALLKELRVVTAKHSLRTLTGFRALGQYVLDCVGAERAKYRGEELAAIGQELRQKLPKLSLPENAVPLLEAARRVARKFSAKKIAVYEKPTKKGFRLRVQHLCVVAMAKNARELLTQCRQQQWSVRELREALAQRRSTQSQGGRPLRSATSGVRTLQKTVVSLRRWAEQNAGDKQTEISRQLQTIEQGLESLKKLVETIEPAQPPARKRSSRR